MKKVISVFVIMFLSIISSVFGEQNSNSGEVMNSKILVVYSTKAGSTEETAIYIGKELEKLGAHADVITAAEVKSISGYKAVIVGGPIYMGQWHKESTAFVEKFQTDLKNVNTAYFFLCLSVKENTPEKQSEVSGYLAKQRSLVEPAAEGRFPGKLDSSRLSFFHKMIIKMIGSKEGDFRDWALVSKWVVETYPLLMK